MKDILAKAVYIKKGDFHGSDGSLTGVPENVMDKWAFETRFVATKQEVLSPPFQVGIISQVLWSSIAAR